MDRPDLPIIILAAGASARMRGRDKLLEDIDGTALITRQARLARAVTSAPVIIALPRRPHARYTALEGQDVTLLEVADAETGMSASIRAAIAALPAGTPAVMLLLADMPDLTESDLKSVLQAVDLTSGTLIWRGATAEGKPGHPVVFSAALFASLQQLTGDSGGQEVIAAARNRIALIALPDSDARGDLDTPEDWAAWRLRRS